eukprot:10226449-Lingulodinium_polyedra.AAC.1
MADLERLELKSRRMQTCVEMLIKNLRNVHMSLAKYTKTLDAQQARLAQKAKTQADKAVAESQRQALSTQAQRVSAPAGGRLLDIPFLKLPAASMRAFNTVTVKDDFGGKLPAE